MSIFFLTDHSVHFETPDYYDYNNIKIRLDEQTWKPFTVSACSDAHITLFEHHSSMAAYEFVFGCCNNKWTVLRRHRLQEPVAQVLDMAGFEET